MILCKRNGTTRPLANPKRYFIAHVVAVSFLAQQCFAFLIPTQRTSMRAIPLSAPKSLFMTSEESELSDSRNEIVTDNRAELELELEAFQKRQALKLSLLFQAKDAKRGFEATDDQKKNILDTIRQLSDLNPTKEPASAYYEDKYKSSKNGMSEDNGAAGPGPSLAGKWTLVYTNAPDIISLDPSLSSVAGGILPISIPPPPPSAKLGRIGQECKCDGGEESTISNVIEWKRPEWIGNILKGNTNTNTNTEGGSESGRVLQKIVCEAKSNPGKPFEVDLTLVGFELIGEESTSVNADANVNNGNDNGTGVGQRSFPLPGGLKVPSLSSLLNEGPAAILSNNPLSLRGPLKAPFGKFDIQFLDDEMRIIKTGQGYYAVNLRESQPWF